MLPHIRTKYQQYKQDTAKLGSWLAETALNFGLESDEFKLSPEEHDSEPQKTAQQTKNAKKKAKAKAKGKAGSGSVENINEVETPHSAGATSLGE